MAIDTNGNTWAWGENHLGQLGLGDLINRDSPQKITLDNIFQLDSWDHTLAIDNFGAVWAWGNNQNGQLGLNIPINFSSPKQITPFTSSSDEISITRALSVSCGGNHSFIIDQNGFAWGFGKNESGQLGLGDSTNRSKPTRLKFGMVSSILCGENHTFIFALDGDSFTCGANEHGQLGLGDQHSRNTPQKLGVKLFLKRNDRFWVNLLQQALLVGDEELKRFALNIGLIDPHSKELILYVVQQSHYEKMQMKRNQDEEKMRMKKEFEEEKLKMKRELEEEKIKVRELEVKKSRERKESPRRSNIF